MPADARDDHAAVAAGRARAELACAAPGSGDPEGHGEPGGSDEPEGHGEPGGSDEPEASGDPEGDIAQDSLRAARAMVTGSVLPSPRRAVRRSRDHRAAGGYSGPRADELDPASLASIFGSTSRDLGWAAPLARARLFDDWSSIVGADVAAHSYPVSLDSDELKLVAESTAWAMQLRVLAPDLLSRINSELGAGMVTRLQISGPSGRSWRRGPWSMYGGRGVRDTYG